MLTDVERIAPCLPGAQLQEIEGDEYRGIVKVKVGPITAQYKGKATFVEKDDDATTRPCSRPRAATPSGQGNASATITATLVPDARGHEGHRAHRPHRHRQGRPVRSRRHGRRQRASCWTSSSSSLETTMLGGRAPARRRSPTAAEAAKPEAAGGDGHGRTGSGGTAADRGGDADDPSGSTIRSPSRSTSSDAPGAPVAKRVVAVVIGVVARLAVRAVACGVVADVERGRRRRWTTSPSSPSCSAARRRARSSRRPRRRRHGPS